MNTSPYVVDVAVAKPTRSSLWRSGFHTFGTSIVSIPLGIATSIIIARTLGPAGKGSYDLVLATSALLQMMVGFSLPSGVTYVVARGRANLGLLALQLAWIALLQGLSAAVILYALCHTAYSTSFLPAQMGNWVIAAVFLYVFFTSLTSYWRAMLIGRQEIIRANWRDIIGKAMYLILLFATIGVLIILGRRASATIVILISAAATMLTSLLFLQALGVSLHKSGGISGLGEAVAYALPCYLGNLTQFLNYRLDVFIVSFFAGVEAVGLYTLAVSLAQLIWLVSNAAATVLLPRIAASQFATIENALRTALVNRLALWASIASAMVLGTLVGPVLPLVYGEAFHRSIYPLLWLLPGIVAFSTVNVLASYFAGIGKPQLNLFVALTGLFVTVTLDLLLIPRLNIEGAAIASTASYSTSAMLTMWLFVRESGIKALNLLLPTREDVRVVASVAGSLLRLCLREAS